MSLLDRPRVPFVDERDRWHPTPLSIAVVDALPDKPIADALHDVLAASGARVVRVRLSLRDKPGLDVNETGGAAHPAAMLEAAQKIMRALPDTDVLLTEGAPLLAAIEPRLAILGCESPSTLRLDPDVRAMRDRFDLVLFDARVGVLTRIAHTIRA